MIYDWKKQHLLLEGTVYTPEDISRCMAEGDEKYPPAIWDLYLFLSEWFNDSPFITVHTSGSTGIPKELTVRKDRMMQSARLTCEYLNLRHGDTALLCMNLRYIGAMMMVVRSLVADLNLIVRPASGHPLATDIEGSLRFASMVPMQVYNTLRIPEEKARLKETDILIIGGGAVDEALETEIKLLPTAVYSTYGMTETLSHIALRRLNGNHASDHYHPFSSVRLSLSAEGTLVIEAPLLCDEILQTNDIAHIYPDGSFSISGRKDNVINSGGIKIQTEEIEKKLRPLISAPFAATSIPDRRLGQALVLLITDRSEIKEIKKKLPAVLEPYQRPKHVFATASIPRTENGKTDRSRCRALALHLFEVTENKANNKNLSIMEISQAAPKFQDASIAPMHTTEHIINQTMIRQFGCGRSVSAHIERKKSKLDYLLTTCPTEEEIKKLEKTVNEVIARQLSVTTAFITQEEARGRFDMQRLPDDASETVRIVKIGDYDECLCIGAHVENTSEIGTFKIISHDWDEETKRWRMRFKLV